ncbi:MAG TPA: serine hydrolase [Paracoccaceae bacterium]|nr:serine hydrolase [Paracoccaceae bacterium]
MAFLTLLAALPVRAAPFAAHVMDARTGETLHSQNAETRLHPASLTKMLTLYIAFDAIRRGEVSLDTMVTVSANAAKKPPSRLGLRAGQRIAMRHLIRAAAIRSANDAASAIGDHLSGNEAAFARRMDRTAKAIGMTNSTFKNANGLTAPGHLSTARDMSVLGRRLFYDFPEYYNLFSRRSADAGVAQVVNTNSRFLDAYPGADGIKTGYTVASGFSLTASAERGGVRIITTVFGGTSTANRNARIAQLMDIGFREAPRHAAVRKPAPVQLPAETREPEPADPPMVLSGTATTTLGNGDGRAAGKTIRLITSVAKSPRPRPRPDPAEAAAAEVIVAAAQDQIEDALAAATAPEPLPFQLVDAATGAPLADPPAVPTEAGLPVALAEAPLAPALRPAARPAALLAAEVPDDTASEAATSATMALADALPADLPFQVVDAQPSADLPFRVVDALPEAEPEPEAIALLSASAVAPLPAIAVPPAALTEAPASPQAPLRVAALRPAPKPMAAPLPEQTEVVVRLSTSGGRHWGVTLGRFASRTAAERALMQTMLSEGAVLSDGLRKIASGAKGFDANIMGLTEDQADLACRRLTARAQTCFTLAP